MTRSELWEVLKILYTMMALAALYAGAITLLTALNLVAGVAVLVVTVPFAAIGLCLLIARMAE